MWSPYSKFVDGLAAVGDDGEGAVEAVVEGGFEVEAHELEDGGGEVGGA